jgi:predicted CoA-binding protein
MEAVQTFLGLRRIAVVGVSSQPSDFSRILFRELRQRGYDVVPVNPKLQEVDGTRCYARVADVAPAVEGALLMTSPAVTEQIVHELADCGVKYAWMYRAVGHGAVSKPAADYGAAHGLTMVIGECPFMFLENAGFPHNLHRLLNQITGSYPSVAR